MESVDLSITNVAKVAVGVVPAELIEDVGVPEKLTVQRPEKPAATSVVQTANPPRTSIKSPAVNVSVFPSAT